MQSRVDREQEEVEIEIDMLTRQLQDLDNIFLTHFSQSGYYFMTSLSSCYPLTCLLECVWDMCKQSLCVQKQPKPTFVELCVSLERALNFMHTGNAAVITTTLMNPLWIGLAIV
jgi:hypothetical protein